MTRDPEEVRPRPGRIRLSFGALRAVGRSPPLVLVALIAVFAVVLTLLGEVRVHSLSTTTWDFGIYQQALWSASHGAPFWESPDWETGGYRSFLQVHSAFVLYALVPVYAALPDPGTLLAVQASAVGAAALPLYGIARALGHSPRTSGALGVLFLVSTPVLAGLLYDFHIEAFIPLVYLTTAFLWQTGRYGWGSIAALVGYLTMEVVPVLFAFLALFTLTGILREALIPPVEAPEGPAGRARLRAALQSRAAIWSMGLFVGSVLAYVALYELRTEWLANWFGFPPFPTYSSGYVIGVTPGALGLSGSNLGREFFAKLSYWLLLFALVAFLPWARPRSLLLVLPWVAFTFLSASANYTILGFQYGLIAVGPLFLGSAHGLRRISGTLDGLAARRSPAPAPDRWRRAGRALRSPWIAGFAVLLVANLAFSPIDPLVAGAGPGSAFTFTYEAERSTASIDALVALVPPNATVLASDDVFPLVANDVHAFSLFWGTNPYLILPFNLTHLPAYVLVAENRLDAAPAWLSSTVYVPADFGIRGVAWGTPAGSVFLLQHHYNGTTAYFGSAPVPPGTIPPSEFTGTGESKFVNDPQAMYGYDMRSVNGGTGQLGTSVPIDLAPGNYSISYWVAGLPADTAQPALDPSTEALTVDASPFAQPDWFHAGIAYGAISGAGFHRVELNVTVVEPVVELTLRWYAADPAIQVRLAAATVVAIP